MLTLRSLFSYAKQNNILGELKYPMQPPKHFINLKNICLGIGYQPKQGHIY